MSNDLDAYLGRDIKELQRELEEKGLNLHCLSMYHYQFSLLIRISITRLYSLYSS